MTREEAIEAALESLALVGCQFWACEGFDAEPKYMITCHVCWSLWDLKQAGVEIGTTTAVTP